MEKCMKKKLIGLISALALVVILATCLVACNPYKYESIGGGDPTAKVESNGGYVVKQGNYVYYINGYAGADEDNTWGTPIRQSIVRAELKKDGTIDNDTTKVVVPKSIYNSSANGGFAIYEDWIYYATPNYDKDKNGTPSTVNTDFMRTKIDGSVTQLIGTIGTRSSQYIFMPKRVLYYESNTVSYIDFSGMKTDKSMDSAKGAYGGTLAENVSNVVWKYGCEDIFYTQTLTGEDSYKDYNKLMAVKYDGTNERTLATENTFLGKNETAVNNPQKVFKFTLLDMYVESDGSATLYYTKTYKLSTDTTVGLFCARAKNLKGTEKQLNTIGSSTVFPLGYKEGALAYNSQNVYCYYDGTNAENPLQVTTTSQTIWKVANGYAYFTSSSSANALYKISYKERKDNISTVIAEGMKVDWLKLDFVGDNLYFFATEDANYMHVVNVKTFDKDAKDAASTYIGFAERIEDEEEETEAN